MVCNINGPVCPISPENVMEDFDACWKWHGFQEKSLALNDLREVRLKSEKAPESKKTIDSYFKQSEIVFYEYGMNQWRAERLLSWAWGGRMWQQKFTYTLLDVISDK